MCVYVGGPIGAHTIMTLMCCAWGTHQCISDTNHEPASSTPHRQPSAQRGHEPSHYVLVCEVDPGFLNDLPLPPNIDNRNFFPALFGLVGVDGITTIRTVHCGSNRPQWTIFRLVLLGESVSPMSELIRAYACVIWSTCRKTGKSTPYISRGEKIKLGR